MRPHFLLILFFFFSNLAWSKVDPPNYNFSLDQLQSFLPGTKVKDLTQNMGDGEFVKKGMGLTTKKYFVAHLRYKFPVIVTMNDNVVLDMYAVLPSYFLHDVFHQSLINRYGKQDAYKLFNGTALFTWNNKNDMKLYYSSTCTITCFPLYFSATTTQNQAAGFVPMIEALSEGHL